MTVLPAQVTLDAANWNTGEIVNVDAFDDGFIEGPHTGMITYAVAPGDANYAAVTVPASSVAITDNDSASVLIDDLGGLSLDEAAVGTTDSFEVRLGRIAQSGRHGRRQPVGSRRPGLVRPDDVDVRRLQLERGANRDGHRHQR